jgi:hypothetical protein
LISERSAKNSDSVLFDCKSKKWTLFLSTLSFERREPVKVVNNNNIEVIIIMTGFIFNSFIYA